VLHLHNWQFYINYIIKFLLIDKRLSVELVKTEAKVLVDGLNDCSNHDYHADRKYLSSSVLKTVYKSLDIYYNEYILGNKKEISSTTQSTFDLGSLVHSYILEPELVDNGYNFFQGFRKAGTEYQEFLKSAEAGKPVISTPQHHQAKELLKAFQAHKVATDLISGGFSEQTICGTLHGVPIKSRFDYINVDKGYIADVKTTSYPSDKESFKLTVEGLMYHLSAALYCAMAEQHYGKPFSFYFIVLSKRDKTCDVFKLSDERMDLGKQIVREACSKYSKALKTNSWTELNQSDTLKVAEDYEIEEI
jgi:exodeoxyribonuclease VIII